MVEWSGRCIVGGGRGTKRISVLLMHSLIRSQFSAIDRSYSTYLLVATDLLQGDVQEHIENTNKLGEDETEDVEEETLAVVEDKQRRLETGFWTQL